MGEIFSDLVIDFGIPNLLTIGERVMQIAHSRSLPHRSWSLAELRLTEKHYKRFSVWLELYQPELLDEVLHSHQCVTFQQKKIRPREVFGFLLLLHISEIARREASEGILWPRIMENIPESLRPLLFNDTGYPRNEIRDLLRKTVALFNLRNAFHQTHLQTFYQTVFLQFGLSLPMIRERLKYWLSGSTIPEYLSYLIDDSTDFRSLWTSLKLLHLRERPVEMIREALKDSPWILPDWSEDLLRAAQERLPTSSTSFSPGVYKDNLQFSIGMLQTAGGIDGVLKLHPPFFDEMRPGVYDIKINDISKPFNTRAGSLSFQFPLLTLNPEVDLSHSEAPDQPNRVAFPFLADGLDYAFFDNTSHLEVSLERGGTFPSDHKYLLLTRAGVGVTSQCNKIPHKWGPDYNLYMIPPGTIASVCLLSPEGERIWSFLKSNPSETEQDQITLTNFRLEDKTLFFSLVVPKSRRLLSLRMGNLPLEISLPSETEDGLLYDTSFQCPVDLFQQRKLIMKLRLEKEYSDQKAETYLQYIQIGNPIQGISLKHNGEWIFPTCYEPLSLHNKTGLELFYRTLENQESRYIFDGPRQCYEIYGNTLRSYLPPMMALGEAFVIAKSAIHHDLSKLKLSARFIDTGIIKDVIRSDDGRITRIQVGEPFQVSSDYAFIYLNMAGQLGKIPFQSTADITDSLIFPLLENEKEIPLWGVSFRNVRIGSWWGDCWRDFFEDNLTADNVATVAAILRWLKFPVLRHLPFFKVIAGRFPWQFLRTWGSSRSEFMKQFPFLEMESENDEDNWAEVFRQVFAHFLLTEENIPRECFQTKELADEYLKFIIDLGCRAPVTAGQLLRAWTEGIKNSNIFENLSPQLFDKLLTTCLPVTGGAINFNQHQQIAFKQLRGPLDTEQHDYLKTFLDDGMRAFRKYLAPSEEDDDILRNKHFEFAQANSSSFRVLLWLRILVELKEEYLYHEPA